MGVADENARAGDERWWGLPAAPPGAIEAYTTECSVVAGDPLGLRVSTDPAAHYVPTVYRLGWYAGTGARSLARLTTNVGLRRSAPLPDPSTGWLTAGWPVTDVVLTAEEWPSGQYLIVLELIDGPHAGTVARIPFVVRALPGDIAPVLVQMPVNTTQAYNHWGGKSLYASGSTGGVAAVKVSFDRPVPAFQEANINARAPFVYELPMIRWLEREGVEVAYQTDVDTHRQPHTLVNRRLVISAGHDEYWTAGMRAAFDDALARGTNLAFMGANTCYWQMRYEDRERTIVVYREAALDPEPDPRRKTILFRSLDPPLPERDLIGVQYEGGRGLPSESREYTFVPTFATDGWASGIEIDAGRPVRRLVGYEWDTLTDGAAATLVRIMHRDDGAASADCVRWTAPSGAQVFAAGSLQFPWALDDWGSPGSADARVQGFMRNGVRQMTA